MEIQLKQLAPYLPYDLRVVDGGCTFTMTGSFIDQWFNYGELGDVKPILRPMSDLDKEITNNSGKTIIFTSQYPGLVHNIKHSLFMSSCVSFYADYSTIESLLEWHFDVFRLIERGLAIDINTLSPNVAG